MLTHSQLTAHVNPIVQNRSSGSDSIQLVVLLSLSHQIANSVEKAMAPHSSTLAWKIPWMDETGRLQSMGFEESDTTERLHFHFSLSCIGEGNGNSLQCSCLENPRDGAAWWATIYGGCRELDTTKVTKQQQKLSSPRASQEAQWLSTHLPMQEMQDRRVRSLGWEDPLEEEIATHSSILAWEIPWTEESGGPCICHGVTKSQTQLSMHACPIFPTVCALSGVKSGCSFKCKP